MRAYKLLALLLGVALIMPTACAKKTAEDISEETEIEVEETTIEETETSTEETEEDTPTPTPRRFNFEVRPSITPIPERVEVLNPYVNTVDLGNEEYTIPQFNIESDEIAIVNESLINMAGEREYTEINCVVYTPTDNIVSVLVDYSLYGYMGKFVGVTVNTETGHVLTNAEILSLVEISSDDFYNQARSATAVMVNRWYGYRTPEDPLVDGDFNPEWTAHVNSDDPDYQMIVLNLSSERLNTNMSMILDDGCNLIIWQTFSDTDSHDCEYLYAVPSGLPPVGGRGHSFSWE